MPRISIGKYLGKKKLAPNCFLCCLMKVESSNLNMQIRQAELLNHNQLKERKMLRSRGITVV